MDSFKNLNIAIAITLSLVVAGTQKYWNVVCGSYQCTLEQMEVLQLLLWGSAVWAVLFATLLAFPSAVFKKWLYFVASWGLIVTVYAAVAINPSSGGVLAIGRGQAAWFAGIFMAGISALFIVGWYILTRVRHTTVPAPASRLLALVVAAVVLYYLSVM